MRVLLDTHALLWAFAGDDRTPEWLRSAGGDQGPAVMFSDASIWEIAIKSSLGRLDVPDDLPRVLDEWGVQALAIEADHLWRVRELPHHHRDPFDRLLIAQAVHEGLVIATADPSFAAYEIPIRWQV